MQEQQETKGIVGYEGNVTFMECCMDRNTITDGMYCYESVAWVLKCLIQLN